jgi:hypothetical protein
MARSLQNLLSTRQNSFDTTKKLDETNLDRGKVFVYCAARQYNDWVYGFCWKAPDSGMALVETWGSGGSIGCQCCCNHSMPGGSGAYVGLCICFDGTAQNYVCGYTGHPCSSMSGFCITGCGTASCITVCNGDAGTCYCICTQSGQQGYQWCHTGQSHICCSTARNYPAATGWSWSQGATGNGCGWVCGYTSQWTQGCAYVMKGGADAFNEPEVTYEMNRYGCVQSWNCNLSTGNPDYNHTAGAKPRGQFTKGQAIAFSNFKNNGNGSATGSYVSGQGPLEQAWHSTAISHDNGSAQPGPLGCWNSNQHCNCYQQEGCIPWAPAGQGASYAQGCPDVRNVGQRGGLGIVRIRFVSDTDTYQ